MVSTATQERPRRRRRRPDAVTQDLPRRVSNVEWVSISVPQPYDNNPRVNDAGVEALASSFTEFGQIMPILIDESDVIIAGHTRLMAAQSLGWDVVMVMRAYLSPEKVIALRIADNKLGELSSWNRQALAEEIDLLQGTGIDFLQLGFNQEEISCLQDMVNDDCLSEGVTDQTTEVTERTGEEGTSQTRIVIGEFVLFVGTEDYQQWSEQLFREHDFVRSDILQELLDRLGFLGQNP